MEGTCYSVLHSTTLCVVKLGGAAGGGSLQQQGKQAFANLASMPGDGCGCAEALGFSGSEQLHITEQRFLASQPASGELAVE